MQVIKDFVTKAERQFLLNYGRNFLEVVQVVEVVKIDFFFEKISAFFNFIDIKKSRFKSRLKRMARDYGNNNT